jgi:hypothetical protein
MKTAFDSKYLRVFLELVEKASTNDSSYLSTAALSLARVMINLSTLIESG